MTRNKRTNKCPSRCLCLNDVKKIIILANKYEKSNKTKYLYKISRELNMGIKKAKRALEKAFIHTIFKQRINQQRKGPKLTKVYSLLVWKEENKERKENKNTANFIKKANEFDSLVIFIKEKYNSWIHFITTNGIKKKYHAILLKLT